MMQSLLAERFKLSVHRESKEQPVYKLIVSKNGPTLQKSTEETNAPVSDASGDDTDARLNISQGNANMDQNGNIHSTGGPYGPIRSGIKDGALQMELLKVTMPQLADFLAAQVDRPVINMTDLEGSYRIVWEIPGASGRVDNATGAIAIQEMLSSGLKKIGLKLEDGKGPVDTIIVDRLEKTPTEN